MAKSKSSKPAAKAKAKGKAKNGSSKAPAQNGAKAAANEMTADQMANSLADMFQVGCTTPSGGVTLDIAAIASARIVGHLIATTDLTQQNFLNLLPGQIEYACKRVIQQQGQMLNAMTHQNPAPKTAAPKADAPAAV